LIRAEQIVELSSRNSEYKLSVVEQDWIANTKIIPFAGDPNWLPYEAFDSNGSYIGMVADYLSVIERETGLKFQPVHVSNWSESLELAVKNKVMVISGDAADVVLNQHFRPIEAYIRNPVVIIMGYQQHYVESLDEIADRKIAAIKNHGYTADIFKRYPAIDFVEVEDIQEGLEGVSQGRFGALLAPMALAGYHIAEMGMHNIKVVGKTPIIMDLTLFIDKDKPLLFSVINKSLKAMSQAEKHGILQAWVQTKYVEKTNYRLAIEVALGLFIILVFALVWNRRLQQEIAKRHETEVSLRRSESLIMNVINQLPDPFILKDGNGNIFCAIKLWPIYTIQSLKP
jgi:ABC-type amino acid transport substrate-binding protein